MATNVRGGGFKFDVCSIGGRWEWDVTASNVQNGGQFYQVENIRSPFGALANTDLPIPGEVITAMAESLASLQQQLQPRVALTGPASFSLTVTEGDPVIGAGAVEFANVGAFGSFMTATASPNSPWLSVDPPSVAGIDKNGSGQISVRVDPRILLATSSPYLGYVNVQDNASPPTLIPVPVNVTVMPRPAIGLSSDAAALAFYLSSMVPAGTASVTITNTGPLTSLLSFTVAKVQNQSPWLAVAPASGSSVPSGGAVTVVLSLVSDNVPSIPGVYTEILRVASPNASNSPLEITVTLTVIA